MKRVNIYLTDQEIAALQQLSQETGLKVAELVRRLIDEGIAAREERKHENGFAVSRERSAP
jgi:Ribbon-helix-helix protein, copG family